MIAELPVLTFHALDARPTPVAVPAETFRGMVGRMAAEGRRTPPLDAVLASVLGDGPGVEASPALPVMFTFDDGYASVREACDILSAHGMTAVLFLAPSLIGRTTIFPNESLCPPQPALTWDEARDLVRRGFAIGSHASDHVDLRALSDGALEDQLVRSRRTLEDRLGVAVRTLAYPFGGVDRRVARAAAEVYDAAFTTRFARIGPGADPHRLPRLDAWYLRFLADRGALDAPSTRAYLAFRAAARRVRALVTGAPA